MLRVFVVEFVDNCAKLRLFRLISSRFVVRVPFCLFALLVTVSTGIWYALH